MQYYNKKVFIKFYVIYIDILYSYTYNEYMNNHSNEAINLALTAINEATEHETTANNVEIAVIKCGEEVYTKLSQEEVQTFIDEVVSEEESEEESEE